MAAKSAQPNRYRKAKDVKVGDMIRMVNNKYEWVTTPVLAKEKDQRGWYQLTGANGFRRTLTGNEYAEGQF